jgi:hypothetical protein
VIEIDNKSTSDLFFDVSHLWSYVDHKNPESIIGNPIYVGCYIGTVVEYATKESGKNFLKIEFSEKVSNYYLLSLGIPQDNILSPYKA